MQTRREGESVEDTDTDTHADRVLIRLVPSALCAKSDRIRGVREGVRSVSLCGLENEEEGMISVLEVVVETRNTREEAHSPLSTIVLEPRPLDPKAR